MLPSGLPGGAVEVGVLELLLDLFEQVPGGGAVGDVVAGRATFVAPGMDLADHVSFSFLRVPNEGGRVAYGGEDLGRLVAGVVDA